jgi:hypothetical protein
VVTLPENFVINEGLEAMRFVGLDVALDHLCELCGRDQLQRAKIFKLLFDNPIDDLGVLIVVFEVEQQRVPASDRLLRLFHLRLRLLGIRCTTKLAVELGHEGCLFVELQEVLVVCNFVHKIVHQLLRLDHWEARVFNFEPHKGQLKLFGL